MHALKTVAEYREENAFNAAWNEGRSERRALVAHAAEESYQKGLISRADNFASIASQSSNYLDALHTLYTGEKFAGGWGINKDFEVVDLPLLRRRSLELWRSNPIANGIFGRLETKMINDGLRVEALPEGRVLAALGLPGDDDFLEQWSESMEAYFNVYSLDPSLVDERRRFNLAQLQRQGYSAAKLSGDILQIRRIDSETFLPRVQLVDGKHIETPFEFINGINPATGRDVIQGVEIDKGGVEVGYWVRTRAFNPNQNNILNRGFVFINAFGPQSGRRVANLVHGSRLRIDEYRGVPLLAQCMQMLKQIDKTMDNHQLSMAIDNSIVLSVVTDVGAPRGAAAALSGGPMKKAATFEKNVAVNQPDGGSKEATFSSFGPGLIFDNLGPGKKIESHNARHPNPDVGKSVLFGINLVSASIDMPPEILMLMFNNNFSASRQAVNELEATRRKEHSQFNPQFNDPIYHDVVIGMELSNRINTPGLMEAIVSNDRLAMNAWFAAQWSSTAELSVDMLKHVNALIKAVREGFIDRTSVALKFFGKRFNKNISKLSKENEELARVLGPLADLDVE